MVSATSAAEGMSWTAPISFTHNCCFFRLIMPEQESSLLSNLLLLLSILEPPRLPSSSSKRRELMRNEADSNEPDISINWSNSEFPGPWQRLRWEHLQRQVRRGELESPRKSVGRSLCHRYHPTSVSLHQALLISN